MDFNHSEDRQMLSDTLARYLQQRYPIDVRHTISGTEEGWSRDQWRSLAELGIIGALFAEDQGGFGGRGCDIAEAFEQVGRALVVEPLLGTVMAGRALIGATAASCIERVIAGNLVLALAHQEPQGRYDLAEVATFASEEQGGWRLTGEKAVVPHLATADVVVVSAGVDTAAGSGAIALFTIDRGAAGVSVRDYPLIDGGWAGELRMDRAPATLVARDALPIIEEATAAGIVALCWEAVGLMGVLRDSTLEYLRTRRQFGAPIGKFQALQHRMATVALEIEQARSAAINAAAALEGDRHRRERAASAAKYTIGRVGTLVAEEAIQMHGGIGMTWELPLSHYAKRLTMIGHQLGDEDHHLQRFIDLDRST